MTVVATNEFTTLKAHAARCFHEKDYNNAIEKYKEALLQEQCNTKHSALVEKSILHSNIALCYLNLSQWENAIKAATTAISLDPSNVKALYRRGIAYENMNNFNDAINDARKSLWLDPKNSEVKSLLERVSTGLHSNRDAQVTNVLPVTALNTVTQITDQILTISKTEELEIAYSRILSKDNVSAINGALAVLRSWIIKRGKRDLLTANKTMDKVAALLKAINPTIWGSFDNCETNDSSTPTDLINQNQIFCETSIPENMPHQSKNADIKNNENISNELSDSIPHHIIKKSHKEQLEIFSSEIFQIQLNILRFITVFIADYDETRSPWDSHEESDTLPSSQGRLCLGLHQPLPINKMAQRARDEVLNSLSLSDFCKLISHTIRSEIPHFIYSINDKTKNISDVGFLKTRCAVLLFNCLQYLGTLDNRDCLDAITLGISCTDNPEIIKGAFICLGYIADSRRRYGSKVLALKKSQGILKIIEEGLQLLVNDNVDLVKDAEFSIACLFILLADKDRAPEDKICMESLGGLLLGPYLNETQEVSDRYIGLKGLLLLWAADRQSVKNLIIKFDYLSSILHDSTNIQSECPQLQSIAAEVLMHCMEFQELRCSILDLNGLSLLVKACNKTTKQCNDTNILLKIAVSLARLCIHDESVRQEAFKQFNFLKIALECLNQSTLLLHNNATVQNSSLHSLAVTSQIAQNFLEILFFLSMHGAFKADLLTHIHEKTINRMDVPDTANKSIIHSLSSIGDYIVEHSDSLAAYYFCNVICNLLRTRHDKERIPQPANSAGPQLDDEQLTALREFFDKLPEHSRPVQNGKYDRGGEDVALALRDIILQLNLCQYLVRICLLKSPPTLNVFSAAAEAIGLLAKQPESRGLLANAGCISALLLAGELFKKDGSSLYKEDLTRCQQSLAHFCISISPKLITYKETFGIIPHLIDLLKDSYELYQYEATLAITNLISYSEEARNRVFYGDGISALFDVATSDNTLCRAAGIEAICNMAMCELFRNKIAEGCHAINLQLLLAFLGEIDNERAQCAAAGCLAMLTADFRVIVRLSEIINIRNILKVIENRDDFFSKPELQIRVLTILLNICQACTVAGEVPVKDDISPESQSDDMCYLKVTDTMKKLKNDILVCVSSLDKTKFVNPKAVELFAALSEVKSAQD